MGDNDIRASLIDSEVERLRRDHFEGLKSSIKGLRLCKMVGRIKLQVLLTDATTHPYNSSSISTSISS